MFASSASLSCHCNPQDRYCGCLGEKQVHLPEPKGEAYSQAVSTLLPYLLSHRSRLAAFRAAEGEANSQSPPASDAAQTQTADTPASVSRSYSDAIKEDTGGEPGSPVQRQPQDFLAALQPEQRHKLAMLIDTAILKVPHLPT